jgi:hypothetical protein
MRQRVLIGDLLWHGLVRDLPRNELERVRNSIALEPCVNKNNKLASKQRYATRSCASKVVRRSPEWPR